MGDDRPIRYVEIDQIARTETVVYRASALGGCPRALVAQGSGMTPREKPEWFQQVLDEGIRMESEINAMWEKLTDRPTIQAQEPVVIEVGEIDGRRVIVRGSIDGADLDGTLREYKKFRTGASWEDFMRRGVEVRPTYPWQVAAYMHGGQFIACEFVGGRYDEATDSIAEVYCKRLYSPPIPLKAIKMKVAAVERAINSGESPMDTACPVPPQFPCGFFYLHDDDEPEEIEVTDPAAVEVAIEYMAARERALKLERAAKDERSVLPGLEAELRRLLNAPEGSRGRARIGGTISAKWDVGDRKGYTVEPKTGIARLDVKRREASEQTTSVGESV